MSEGQLGDVKFSILKEGEFRKLNGDGWVLMKELDIKDSDLFPLVKDELPDGKLPDARGVFIRGMNMGRDDGKEDPEGNRKVGSFQADQLQDHRHTVFKYNGPKTAGSGHSYPNTAGNYPTSPPIDCNHGEETRPRNIALYIYLYKNYRCLTYLFLEN